MSMMHEILALDKTALDVQEKTKRKEDVTYHTHKEGVLLLY